MNLMESSVGFADRSFWKPDADVMEFPWTKVGECLLVNRKNDRDSRTLSLMALTHVWELEFDAFLVLKWEDKKDEKKNVWRIHFHHPKNKTEFLSENSFWIFLLLFFFFADAMIVNTDLIRVVIYFLLVLAKGK